MENNPPNNGLTPSPYGPSHEQVQISKETFEKIRAMLGVESLCIIADKYTNDCDGINCTGHYTFFRSEGFNRHNIAGVGDVMMRYAEEISKSNDNMP